MASVTGMTAAAMQQIADETVVSGNVDANGVLTLRTRGGVDVNAGSVKGDPGAQGPVGLGPIGSIVMFGGLVIPTGFLICDGSAISRSTYSDLFKAIGTAYGVGDGSSTFHLPDLRGRVPVGMSSAPEFNALGVKGGATSHILTEAQMPSHSHVQEPHVHAQNVLHSSPQSLTNVRLDFDGDSPGGHAYPQGVNTLATTAINRSTGGGQAHNNLQPYLVMHYIIKT